jgi:hypothetical protein
MSFRCVVYSSYPKDVKFNGAYGSSRPGAAIRSEYSHSKESSFTPTSITPEVHRRLEDYVLAPHYLATNDLAGKN